MSPALTPAVRPTMYFIGVTTVQSSIHRVFPRWAEELGLGECELRGIDVPLHAPREDYRAIVASIRRDPLVRGALVTTHKVAVHAAARDLFEDIEPLSDALGEISSIYKREGRLHGRSVDLESAGHALAAFLPAEHWRNTDAEALILGAGGAGTALAWHLAQGLPAGARPARIHAIDRAGARLSHLRGLHAQWPDAPALSLYEIARPMLASAVIDALPPDSLVVNATGLGKDAPGSPLAAATVFPLDGFVWEFNYRGDLQFLAQARAQQATRGLRVEDGWTFFLHGWTRVLADVFACAIPTSGPGFDVLGRIAAAAR